MELTKRPRRLRGTDTIRRLCRETRLSTDSLIYPLFRGRDLVRPAAHPLPAGGSTTTAWTPCPRRWRSASRPG